MEINITLSDEPSIYPAMGVIKGAILFTFYTKI